MAGGRGGEKTKIFTLKDKEAWGIYDQILTKLEDILTRPKAAKNIRQFIKKDLPLMLNEIIKRNDKMDE